MKLSTNDETEEIGAKKKKTLFHFSFIGCYWLLAITHQTHFKGPHLPSDYFDSGGFWSLAFDKLCHWCCHNVFFGLINFTNRGLWHIRQGNAVSPLVPVPLSSGGVAVIMSYMFDRNAQLRLFIVIYH